MDTSPLPLPLPCIGSSPAALAAAAHTGDRMGHFGAARRRSGALAMVDFAPTPAPAVLGEHELLCSQVRDALPSRAVGFLHVLQVTDMRGILELRELPRSAAYPAPGGSMGAPGPEHVWLCPGEQWRVGAAQSGKRGRGARSARSAWMPAYHLQ